MVTPVAPFRPSSAPDNEAGAPPPTLARTPPDPASLPDRSSTNDDLVARAIRAAVPAGPPTEAEMQARLDAFKASTTINVHTPDGSVAVDMPFRMRPTGALGGTSPFGVQEARVLANKDVRVDAEASVGLRGLDGALVGGRATPAQIQRVTQALVDGGALPPPDGKLTLAARVRVMMADHGLGLDCAGYAQQAMMAATGLTRSRANLDSVVANEDLHGLGRRGYVDVGLEGARPGDILSLAPPPGENVGHNVVIREVGYASPGDLAMLAKVPGAGKLDPEAVTKMVVDASWGNGGDPQAGGVGRRTWFHDEASGTWFEPKLTGYSASKTPYQDHPIAGVFRRKEGI